MPVELGKQLSSYGPYGLVVLVLLYAVVRLFNLLMEAWTTNNRVQKKLAEEMQSALRDNTKVIEQNSKTLAESIATTEQAKKIFEAAGVKAQRSRINKE